MKQFPVRYRELSIVSIAMHLCANCSIHLHKYYRNLPVVRLSAAQNVGTQAPDYKLPKFCILPKNRRADFVGCVSHAQQQYLQLIN
jgi:hypothetical protein